MTGPTTDAGYVCDLVGLEIGNAGGYHEFESELGLSVTKSDVAINGRSRAPRPWTWSREKGEGSE